jgi:cysteinyl-tRNA synthetase
MDFVLWKPSKPDEPGWDSPWGRGRPGWHIECSAMSYKHLGEVFDIHGGGIDLVFPHHENEIAQTRCAFGHNVMANVWMHNGFLQVEGEKMSKSLGNFITIHELLHSDKFGGKAWKGEVLRLAMLRSHYRQPIDWTVKALEEAEKTLARWYSILRAHGLKAEDAAEAPLRQSFVEALCDDLNIPRAMAELHAMASKAEPRGGEESQTARSEAEKLARAAGLLGLLQDDPAVWEVKAPDVMVDVAEVEKLIAERLAARRAKNFAESDRLRDVLTGLGLKLKDSKDKATGEPTTEWEVAG